MQAAEVLMERITKMSWGQNVIFVVRKAMNCMVPSSLFVNQINVGLVKFYANVSSLYVY